MEQYESIEKKESFGKKKYSPSRCLEQFIHKTKDEEFKQKYSKHFSKKCDKKSIKIFGACYDDAEEKGKKCIGFWLPKEKKCRKKKKQEWNVSYAAGLGSIKKCERGFF